MPPKPNHHRATDWQTASKECLVVALDRAKLLAQDAGDFKSLESLIKTVSDIVGFAADRGRSKGGSDGLDDDE